jgi:DNA-binding beta-propeller fold protein YncE
MKMARFIFRVLGLALVVTSAVLPVKAIDKKHAPEPVKIDKQWPPAPQQARFKLLQVIRGEHDVVVRKKKSILERVVADESSPTYIQFLHPFAVAGDKQGKLYVADTWNNALFAVDPANRGFHVFGADNDVKLKLPLAIAVDSQGRVWVADGQLKSVFCYGPDEKLLLQFGSDPGTPQDPTPVIQRPAGIAVDEKRQRVYVSDAGSNEIFVFDTGGKFLAKFGKAGMEPGEFLMPGHLLVDPSGKLYAVDQENARIQIFDTEFNLLEVLGQRGDRVGMFGRPKSIALDSEGHLYVSDAYWNHVEVYGHDPRVKDPEKLSVLIVIGEGGREQGQFQCPAGIYINQYDQVFVADQVNGRVQVIQYLAEHKK